MAMNERNHQFWLAHNQLFEKVETNKHTHTRTHARTHKKKSTHTEYSALLLTLLSYQNDLLQVCRANNLLCGTDFTFLPYDIVCMSANHPMLACQILTQVSSFVIILILSAHMLPFSIPVAVVQNYICSYVMMAAGRKSKSSLHDR